MDGTMQVVIHQPIQAFGFSTLKNPRTRVLHRLGPFEDFIHAVLITTGMVDSDKVGRELGCQIRVKLADGKLIELTSHDGITTRAFEHALQRVREALEARFETHEALDALPAFA